MTLNDSEQKLLDEMLKADESREKSSYLEVYDGNFEEVSKTVNDGIGALLANAGIAIAEQKKLLQSAKTPTALQNALKLIAVTAGNLIAAGTGMLKFMGNQLPQRDCDTTKDVEDALPQGYGFNFLSWLGGMLPQRVSILKDSDVVLGVSDGSTNGAVLHRKGANDYAVVVGDSGVVGLKSYDKAVDELTSLFKKG